MLQIHFWCCLLFPPFIRVRWRSHGSLPFLASSPAFYPFLFTLWHGTNQYIKMIPFSCRVGVVVNMQYLALIYDAIAPREIHM